MYLSRFSASALLLPTNAQILSQLLELLTLKAPCLGKVFSQWLSTFSRVARYG